MPKVPPSLSAASLNSNQCICLLWHKSDIKKREAQRVVCVMNPMLPQSQMSGSFRGLSGA